MLRGDGLDRARSSDVGRCGFCGAGCAKVACTGLSIGALGRGLRSIAGTA